MRPRRNPDHQKIREAVPGGDNEREGTPLSDHRWILAAASAALLAAGACTSSGTGGSAGPGASTTSSAAGGTSTALATTTSSLGAASTSTSRAVTTSSLKGGPTSTPATTTAVTSATTTSSAPAAGGVSLRGDGIGIATFGEAEDVAQAALVAAFGPPTLDTGWQAANTGMEERANRVVMWGGLSVKFLENDAGRYLASWRVSGFAEQVVPEGAPTPALETADGLRLGLSYTEVAGRLGTPTTVWGEGASGYRVERPEGPLFVWFDPPMQGGDPAPDATVVVLDAGDPGPGHDV